MADPFTLASVGIGATGGGSLLSAGGALMKGISGSQMYGYQAGMSEINRQIALQNRDYAISTGESQAARYGMEARRRMGAIRAGEGASGIDVGSGSKAAVQQGQRTVTGIDLATIRNNAARKAYGFEVEAAQDEAQAGLYRKASSSSLLSGSIGALGSLVTGSASVADKWLQGQSTGIFGSSTDDLEAAGP